MRIMMMPQLIAKAFEKTGLYPVNRSVFTPADFVPSKASSTVAHVPETFPDVFPPSDPIELSDSETIHGSGSEDDSDPHSRLTMNQMTWVPSYQALRTTLWVQILCAQPQDL